MKKDMQMVHANPVKRLFWLLICCIFVCELVVMLFLSVLPPLSRWNLMLLDSTLLSIIVLPLLYFFVLRPMINQITERKQTEEALRVSEERFRSVVDNIAIGVSVISPDMKILSLNALMKKWFPHIDVSQKSLCYKAFNDPPRSDICSYCPTIKTLKDGKVHDSVTATPTEDETRFYHVISSPLFDKDGRIIAAVEMVDDITEHKKAEEALERYSTELAKSNKELQDALANIKTLSGMLPICASCKKIRDDKGYWSGVETYVSKHTDAVFTSGICPECEKKAYEELEKLKKEIS